eukprot:TRINITY_DN11424_c0_g1_i1.p1 TRINITY_DN11424_c0_g1~~TRINITY_DN11424_c0_g1_i1.p1  ORF type:complete len:995 (+),score=174.04 TRINITY_DN11424_c0_g1_i1:32-2986(+)
MPAVAWRIHEGCSELWRCVTEANWTAGSNEPGTAHRNRWFLVTHGALLAITLVLLLQVFEEQDAYIISACVIGVTVSLASVGFVCWHRDVPDVLLEGSALAYVTCVLLHDLNSAILLRTRTWPCCLILLDILLVFRVGRRVQYAVVSVTVVWLVLTECERVARFGLFDLPGAPSEARRFASTECDSPPCGVPPLSSAAGLLALVSGCVAEFVLMRILVQEEKHDNGPSESTLASRDIVLSLASFNAVEAEAALHRSSPALPPELQEAFHTTVATMKLVLPFLPAHLLPLLNAQPRDLDAPRPFQTMVLDTPTEEALPEATPLAPSPKAVIAFTDIANCAAIWEAAPHVMKQVVYQHNAIVRDEMQRHSGVEVKAIGDAFMVAFQAVLPAVKFGVCLQTRLAEAPFPKEFFALVQGDADAPTNPLAPYVTTPSISLAGTSIPQIQSPESDPLSAGAGQVTSHESSSSGDASSTQSSCGTAVPEAFQRATVTAESSDRGLTGVCRNPSKCLLVRVGIHCGPVEVEYVELTGRVDYTGPAVQQAARIAEVSVPGSVAVSSEILILLRRLNYSTRHAGLRRRRSPLGSTGSSRRRRDTDSNSSPEETSVRRFSDSEPTSSGEEQPSGEESVSSGSGQDDCVSTIASDMGGPLYLPGIDKAPHIVPMGQVQLKGLTKKTRLYTLLPGELQDRLAYVKSMVRRDPFRGFGMDESVNYDCPVPHLAPQEPPAFLRLDHYHSASVATVTLHLFSSATVQSINAAVSAIITCVERSGGTPATLCGTRLSASWNVVAPLPAYREASLRFAHITQKRIEVTPFQASVGIAHSSLLSGNLGNTIASFPAFIGPCVPLSNDLASCARDLGAFALLGVVGGYFGWNASLRACIRPVDEWRIQSGSSSSREPVKNMKVFEVGTAICSSQLFIGLDDDGLASPSRQWGWTDEYWDAFESRDPITITSELQANGAFDPVLNKVAAMIREGKHLRPDVITLE